MTFLYLMFQNIPITKRVHTLRIDTIQDSMLSFIVYILYVNLYVDVYPLGKTVQSVDFKHY